MRAPFHPALPRFSSILVCAAFILFASNAFSVSSTPPLSAATAGAEGGAAAFRMNWLLLFILFIEGGIFYYFSRIIYKAPPIPPPLESLGSPGLCGLGGWLVLVGIGICLRPLLSLVSTTRIMLPFFDLNTWEALTLSTSAGYQPMWAFVIVAEYTINLFLLATSILLVFLFFAKKRRFAPVFVTMLAAMFILPLVDHVFLARLVQIDMTREASFESIKEMVQVFIQAAIWIPYALLSKRVKYTFTR